jgi:hypothetical protein
MDGTNDLQRMSALLDSIQKAVEIPFWQHFDFWIALILGVAGLYFSILAFIEARKAKHAATEAGKTVKIQTITIELSDILPKLDKLQPEINFNEARDLLNEITRRLRRVVSPFEKDAALCDKISALREALDKTKESLNKVRPTDPTKDEIPRTVYYAVESDFATINNAVADLLGLFEKKTINFGDEDAIKP